MHTNDAEYSDSQIEILPIQFESHFTKRNAHQSFTLCGFYLEILSIKLIRYNVHISDLVQFFAY